jgi:hypothetical protein
MDTDKFRVQLKEIARRINYADVAFESYVEMSFGNIEWNEVYKVGGAFWAVTRKSLMENSFIYICAAYQRLKGLLDHEDKLGSITITDPSLKSIFTCRSEFEEYNNKFLNLKKIRDKALAHFDRDWLDHVDTLFNMYSLSIEDIRYMIELERDTCNTLIGSNMFVRYHNYNDISYVLGFFHKCSKKKDNR